MAKRTRTSARLPADPPEPLERQFHEGAERAADEQMRHRKAGGSHMPTTGSVELFNALPHNRIDHLLVLLILLSLIPVAAGLENHDLELAEIAPGTIAPMDQLPAGAALGRLPAGVTPDRITAIVGETFAEIIFFLVGYVVSLVNTMLGPTMGISSVLWFMMRNDAAIEPIMSWMVFGAWSILTLIYLAAKCRRVASHNLYILLVLMFAGLCMCIVGLVQKSAIQGGLATAIPTCLSFSAYAVAFFFPDAHKLRARTSSFV